MPKIQKHIEIVRSTTRGLSSMSLRSSKAIQASLRNRYSSVGVSLINNSSDLDVLASKHPDLVFMGMKYIPGLLPNSKIWISDYLEENNIPHTGSEQKAIEYELSKPLAKQRVRDAGIPTARFMVAKQGSGLRPGEVKLTYPLFVKPASLGGGEGVDEASLVHSFTELKEKVSTIHKQHAADALIEEYLPGREFSVAILKDIKTLQLTAMPIELVAPMNEHGNPVLSQEIKTANEEVVLPVTNPALFTIVNATALEAFKAIGARDYGRIDIRLDAKGVPHFLEANLIPSLISGYGSFPKACVINAAMGYQTMIEAITTLGFRRSVVKSRAHIAPSIDSLAQPTSMPTHA